MIEHDHMYNQTVHKFSMINLILENFWKHLMKSLIFDMCIMAEVVFVSKKGEGMGG